jgi:hypothetical protein
MSFGAGKPQIIDAHCALELFVKMRMNIGFQTCHAQDTPCLFPPIAFGLTTEDGVVFPALSVDYHLEEAHTFDGAMVHRFIFFHPDDPDRKEPWEQ